MINKAYLKGYNQLVKQHSSLNDLTKSKIEEISNKRANLIKKSNILETNKDFNVNNLNLIKNIKKTNAYFSPEGRNNSKCNTITNTDTTIKPFNKNIINNISSHNPRSKSKENKLRNETVHHGSYLDTEQFEEVNQTKQMNYSQIKVFKFILNKKLEK